MKAVKAVIYSDGASFGNPGKAGIGGVVSMGDETVEFSWSIGVATNNVAEYSALIEALKKALEMGASEAEVFMDSELVVKQINGQYKVKHENIKPLFKKASSLLSSFKKFSVRHIPREKNKRADALSKKGVTAALLCPPAKTGQQDLF